MSRSSRQRNPHQPSFLPQTPTCRGGSGGPGESRARGRLSALESKSGRFFSFRLVFPPDLDASRGPAPSRPPPPCGQPGPTTPLTLGQLHGARAAQRARKAVELLHRSLHPRRALRVPPPHRRPPRPAPYISPGPVQQAEARACPGYSTELQGLPGATSCVRGPGCCRADYPVDTRLRLRSRLSCCHRRRVPPGLARPSGNCSFQLAEPSALGGVTLGAPRPRPRGRAAECAGCHAATGRIPKSLERHCHALLLLPSKVVQEQLPPIL